MKKTALLIKKLSFIYHISNFIGTFVAKYLFSHTSVSQRYYDYGENKNQEE